MKKILLPILLFVMFIPFEVGAKEYCKVVSGNGKDIGSEIACGTEHFYIIDSNEDEIKMLAKYNLYTGVTIYKEKLEEGQTCAELASSKGGKVKNDQFYNDPEYCFYTLTIKDGSIHQSEEAISAHWDDNGNYLYPQVGDVYPLSYKTTGSTILDFSQYNVQPYSDDILFRDLTIVSNGPNIGTKLNNYNIFMESNGYQINQIDLLTLRDLNNLASYRGRSLPLEEWHTRTLSYQWNFVQDKIGNIKNYVNNEDNWIYGSTYWLKTSFGDLSKSNSGLFFVDSLGEVCGSGGTATTVSASNCEIIVNTIIGCGVRPVITIPNELEYLIKPKTDGNGTIDVVENSLGGEIIQFKVSTNKGYKLRSVLITTDSGEEVEFSEGEITKNDDGTLSIDKNKFTMPFENVTIQAKFELESILKNPETGNKILLITLILVASIGIGTFIYKRKESRYNI